MYRLYVIELRKSVFTENRKFREANPQFNGVQECLYVGMTSKTPKERFEQHKKRMTGSKGLHLSSAIVCKYGTFLRPSLYNSLPEYTNRDEALKAEKELAADLRRQRYAVWVN
jgi:predicted GIY-YIG superfamily endonuclease